MLLLVLGHSWLLRRRRRSALVAVPLALVLLVAAAGIGEARQPARPERATPVDAAEFTAASTALLARRAGAVLTRDRAAWRADLDPHDQQFLARQERVFDALVQLRFDSWRYELLGRNYTVPALASRYGATPYVLPGVLLHYALRGYDPAPVARAQILTLARRDGRWLLSADSDVDELLPPAGHADPWDRRAVAIGQGRHSLVLADERDRDHLDDLVRTADEAVERVTCLWPMGWRRKVVVVAVRDQQLLETYFRLPEADSRDVGAITVRAFDDVPGWSQRPAPEPAQPPSRVIVNPRYFDPDNAQNLDLLTHEIAHVATLPTVGVGTPEWLVEGIAEYAAYRTYDSDELDPVQVSRELRAEAVAGSVALSTTGFYSGAVSDHYTAGWLACRLIEQRVGERGLRTFFARFRSTMRVYDAVPAQEAALQAVLGLSSAEFEQALATYTVQHAAVDEQG